MLLMMLISIHTLTRRMTAEKDYKAGTLSTSIHILTRRRTVGSGTLNLLPEDFNPHPRVEGDIAVHPSQVIDNEFQSTPSRGG